MISLTPRSAPCGGKTSYHSLLVQFSAGALVFFLVISFYIFTRSVATFYKEFGLYSPTYDVYLYRFVMFCLLSFFFNAAFGGYFGLTFFRKMSKGSESPNRKVPLFPMVNLGLLGFFAWCILFNVPSILVSLADGEHRGWPPRTLPASIYCEMFLFIPMGNLGAFIGFFGALLGARIRQFFNATH